MGGTGRLVSLHSKTGKSRRTQKGPKGFSGSSRGSRRNEWAVRKWPTRKPSIKFPPDKGRCGKAILLIRCGDIECLDFRFFTAGIAENESLLHMFKLECQGPQCEGLDCNRGCYKEVNQSCHAELDNSDMFMLDIEFPAPGNFVCKKCVDASDISSKLVFLRNYP